MKTLLQPLIALSIILLCPMQVFTQGGNVGIGIINPLHPLHVETAASMFGSRAIYGLATAGSGTTYGVYGESLSTGGTGVFGSANASSDITYGVYGKSLSTSGRGVYGEATSAGSGNTYGVYGKSLSTSGRGVFGDATASSGFTYGVYGHSSSTSGRGVFGHATASSGFTYGVWGQSSSTIGRGVYGSVTADSGSTYGVYGDVNSPDGFAGYFTGPAGSRNYFQRSVGIGTTVPSRLLHVSSGSSGAGSNTNSVAIFESAGNTYVSTLSGADDENGILFSIPANSAHGGIIYNSSATPGGMHLRTGGNLTQMTILPDGKVGIGTQTPTERLHVAGNICYTGSIAACSDFRYKTAFAPLMDVLPKISSVGTYTYRWKLEEYPDKGFDDRPQIGIIAQEIQDVFPELIVTDGDGYLSVDYTRLSVLLLAAIQEQQELLEAREAEMEQLMEMLRMQQEQIGSILSVLKNSGDHQNR